MRDIVKTIMNIWLLPNDSALSSQLIRYINNTTATMRRSYESKHNYVINWYTFKQIPKV